MDSIRRKLIEELREAREDLLSISKDIITQGYLHQWLIRWTPVFKRVDGLIGILAVHNMKTKLSSYTAYQDTDILYEGSIWAADFIDNIVYNLDQDQPMKPILDQIIVQVTDTQLQTLLKEFNNSRHNSPTISAIGFRTILCHVIRQRALIVNPSSKLAIKGDLSLENDINDAINQKIFSDAETRDMKRFISGGRKDTFDYATHKIGSKYLVEKDDLEDAVELLNRILPAII